MMTMPSADMDWNGVWAGKIDLWQESSGRACREFWADKASAEIFAKRDIEHHKQRIEQTLSRLDLRRNMRVLDIGAGPGNLAVPMAARTQSVTALEPSPGMSQVLADRILHENIINIRLIEQSWEEVPLDLLVPPFDLVVASLSLGMRDIRTAVEKMNRVCDGQVALFWHGGIPEWEDMPSALWPDLYGKPYHGGPKGDVLFMVLYQMGICPEVEVFSNYFCEVFASMDEAVDFYCRRFQSLGPEHRPILRTYLEAHCEKTAQGLVHGFRHLIMKFSWSSQGGLGL